MDRYWSSSFPSWNGNFNSLYRIRYISFEVKNANLRNSYVLHRRSTGCVPGGAVVPAPEAVVLMDTICVVIGFFMGLVFLPFILMILQGLRR